jgi:hypothetical protein
VEAVRYHPDDRERWDRFVEGTRNGVFLFQRGYMDYHADRFVDHSLLIRDEGGRLVAAFPATARDGLIVSHGGLTFGGLLVDDRTRAATTLRVLDKVLERLSADGFQRLLYKAVPAIYHRAPAQDDLYALFRAGGRLVRRDVSSTLDMRARIGYSKGRRWGVGKARRDGISVEESRDFAGFMRIEEANLERRDN